MFDFDRVKRLERPKGLPFQIGKIGHIVINVRDVAKSAEFYTQILGFQISDVYPDEMVPGGMVFMRCNPDHHGIALVGSMEDAAPNVELNHIAFEVPSLDDVVRAGCQIAVEFRDPDNHRLEIYWGIDQIGSEGKARSPQEWDGKPSIEAALAAPVPGQDLSLRDPALLKG
jgi:catechol 2,3-dioxygenase-like lactoylglutathione lyase family enzyme